MKKRAKPWPVDNGIYAAILTLVKLYPNGLTSGELSRMLNVRQLKVLMYTRKLKLLGLVKSHRRGAQNILHINELYVDKDEEYTFNALIEKLKNGIRTPHKPETEEEKEEE